MAHSNKHLRRTLALILSILTVLSLPFTALSAEDGDNDESSAAEQLAKAVEGETLPVIRLTTDDGSIVDSKTEYKSGRLQMTLPERFAEYENACTTDTGDAMQIRCRGNSSFETNEYRLGDAAKYSYRIKLEHKADLLGMGESRHWVLIANFYDITNMRNKLVYDLSGMMGMPYLESRWVIVYMNGEYRGLYNLVEKLRVDETSVNITDWEERAELVAEAIGRAEGLNDEDTESLGDRMKANLKWVTSGKFESYVISDYYDTSHFDINSGYLIEYDARMDSDKTKFYTEHGKPIQIKSPEAISTNRKMLKTVEDLLSDFEEAIYSPSFCTSDGRHYSEFVDVDSMIDYHMIFELFKNFEFGCLSIYLYIEDGMIHFGPCWDFDLSSANRVALSGDTYSSDSWLDIEGRAEWWKKLCADPVYATKMAERWFEIRPLVDEMLDSMEIYHSYIKLAADKSTKKIGLPKCWYDDNVKLGYFEEEYKLMSEWMYARVDWLDGAFAAADPNIDNSGIVHSDRLRIGLTATDESLAKEERRAGGAYCEYQLLTSGSSPLVLTIKTAHTSHVSAEVYVNGKKLGTYQCTTQQKARVTIDRSALDMTEGTINVIYIAMINSSGNYYYTESTTVRAVNSLQSGNALKIWGQPMQTLEKGTKVTLPEIDLDYHGYSVLGYTDGERIYAVGSEYTLKKDSYLWVKLARDDIFPELVQDAIVYPTITPTPEEDPTADDTTIEKPKKSSATATAIYTLILSVAVFGTAGFVFAELYTPKNKKETKRE